MNDTAYDALDAKVQKILELLQDIEPVNSAMKNHSYFPVTAFFRKGDKHPLRKVIFELDEYILQSQSDAYHEGYCDMAKDIKEILEGKNG